MSKNLVSFLLTDYFALGSGAIAPLLPPAPTYTYDSLFSDRATTNEGNDNTDYELGIIFKPLVAGHITALKFYKTINDSWTTRKGRLWDSATKQVLLEVDIVNAASDTGWVTHNLATPYAVTANTIYCASVPARYYPFQPSGLPGDNYTNGQLNGIDGTFGNIATYPSGSFNDSQYFRDVIFRY